MNTPINLSHISSPPIDRGIQTQIGAGTFIISRQYVGTCPACDLLQQRMQQEAHNIIH